MKTTEVLIRASGEGPFGKSLRIEVYTDCLFYFDASRSSGVEVDNSSLIATLDNMELEYIKGSPSDGKAVVEEGSPFLSISSGAGGGDRFTLSTIDAINVSQNVAE